MNTLKENFISIISIVTFFLAVLFIVLIVKDLNKIKKMQKSETELKVKLDSLNAKMDYAYKHATDSIEKTGLLTIQENAFDTKKEVDDFKHEKEEEIKELYMHQMKYWAYLIALFTSLIVFTGIKWNYHEYIKKKLATLFEDKKTDIEKMVENKSWEFNLINNAHIMVADPNTNDNNPYLNKVLKWFGPEGKGNKDSIKKLNNIDFSKPDEWLNQVTPLNNKLNILLLDNSDGNWNLSVKNNPNFETNISNAIKIAAKINNNVFLVYFGPRDKGNFPTSISNYKDLADGNNTTIDENKAKDIVNRISFANAPSKLYVTLVETLKYMDILGYPKNSKL